MILTSFHKELVLVDISVRPPRGEVPKAKDFCTLCQAPWRTPAPGNPETGIVQLQLQLLADHVSLNNCLAIAAPSQVGEPETISDSITKVSSSSVLNFRIDLLSIVN